MAASAGQAAPARRTSARPKQPKHRSGAARGSAARRVARPSPHSRARPASRPARAARSRTSAARRARVTPPRGFAMLPVHAVGGAAGAVGGIADSGLVVRLTRGRLWIGVLGVLLGGIVALNVWGLSLSASTSGIAAKIDELEQANSVQRARIARRGSSERVQALATRAGLGIPAPRAVRYLKLSAGDAAAAAERLAAGQISVLAALPIAPELVGDAALVEPVDAAATDPALAPATDPATLAVEPAPTEPAAAPAPAPQPAAPATTAPPPDGGGMAP